MTLIYYDNILYMKEVYPVMQGARYEYRELSVITTCNAQNTLSLLACILKVLPTNKLTALVTMDRESFQKLIFCEWTKLITNTFGNYFNPKALQIVPLKTNSHFTDNTAAYVWVGRDGNKHNSLMAF